MPTDQRSGPPTGPVWRDPPVVAVPPAAVDVAQRWVAAFLFRPGTTADAWRARLAPLTTAELLGVLTTDGNPDGAPSRMTGPGVAVGGAPGSAVVEVPTDRGVLRLDLVDDLVGAAGPVWRVAAVDITTEPAAAPGGSR